MSTSNLLFFYSALIVIFGLVIAVIVSSFLEDIKHLKQADIAHEHGNLIKRIRNNFLICLVSTLCIGITMLHYSTLPLDYYQDKKEKEVRVKECKKILNIKE